jgi:ribonucleoside-diphosphate reductase alpha chain
MGIMTQDAEMSATPVLGVDVSIGKRCRECGNHAVIRKDGCDFCTACGAIGACG